MAANNEDIQQISSACAIATQALEAIGNLQTNDIRNLAASTATNSTSSSSIPPTNSASIATELIRIFPTYNARGRSTNNRKRVSSSSVHGASSSSKLSKFGRPLKNICHKDLVIIPNPNTNQVPSHSSKVKLEERGLILHEISFR